VHQKEVGLKDVKLKGNLEKVLLSQSTNKQTIHSSQKGGHGSILL